MNTHTKIHTYKHTHIQTLQQQHINQGINTGKILKYSNLYIQTS